MSLVDKAANQRQFIITKVLNEVIEQHVKSGDWTTKRGLYGILKHEMVHMLSYKYSPDNSDTFEVEREYKGIRSKNGNRGEKKSP